MPLFHKRMAKELATAACIRQSADSSAMTLDLLGGGFQEIDVPYGFVKFNVPLGKFTKKNKMLNLNVPLEIKNNLKIPYANPGDFKDPDLPLRLVPLFRSHHRS